MRISLDDGFLLRHEPLAAGVSEAQAVAAKPDGWIPISLPCDVHMAMIGNGIPEPLEKLNSSEAKWLESKSWWFKKKLDITPELMSHDIIELTIESIDSHGDIFVNGAHVGRHESCHYPFVRDIKPFVEVGRPNELLVRVTHGLESISDGDMALLDESVSQIGPRFDPRRAYVRRPQYSIGWDWSPRLVTCGLTRGASLHAYDKAVIRDFSASTVILRSETTNCAVLELDITADNLSLTSTRDAKIEAKLFYEDTPITEWEEEVWLKSGLNHVLMTLMVDQPKLWWPNGYGAQPLYRLSITLECEGAGHTLDTTVALRTIEIDTAKTGEGDERGFAVTVNDVPIFCRGGDWIPADAIYARVSDDKYKTLIDEAQNAGFNMLRIWGGGLYEKEIFYDLCDRSGILVWQDFMFACARYPDHLDFFKALVTKELEYQTKRLRNHACIALFCGNNENQWIFEQWFGEHGKSLGTGGWEIYNYIAPEIVYRNCPHIPYWNSSPYGGAHPNGDEAGNRHYWHECTMNPDMQKRITPEEYDKLRAKFVTEYGYIGPCMQSTMKKYFGDEPISNDSEIFKHHDNEFDKNMVPAGVEKHYGDITNMDIADYTLYAQMVQGLMLGYSLESIRSKPFCSGGLFWMYNDCWGEVGWTIIDYYLTRKPSYYFVKRAFEPVHFILRRDGGEVIVTGCNDTPEDKSITVEAGWWALDASAKQTAEYELTLPARSREVVLRFPMPQGKSGVPIERGGMVAVWPLNGEALPATLRLCDWRDCTLPAPRLVVSQHDDGSDRVLTVMAQGYAHGVHFTGPDTARYDECYFDLLPGETRIVRAFGRAGEEISVKTVL